MKKSFYTLIISVIFSLNSYASVPRVLVIDVVVQQAAITPEAATALLKLELDKTQKYTSMDRREIMLSEDPNLLTLISCTGLECMVKLGKAAEADKVVQCSLIKFGNKMAITLKLIDVATGTIEKTDVTEFIVLEDQIQHMFQISVNNLLEIENDKLLTEKLIYYTNVSDVPVTRVNNNGPRMGMAYVGGFAAERLTADESQGGYEMSPVFSQFGYQLEAQYLSAGNLQALAEFLFMFSGLDQQMCIPSLTIMNGFRLNDSGWEVAFGPSLRLQRKARGFLDGENWILSKSIEPSYDENGQTLPIEGEQLAIDRRGNVYLTSGWVWAVGKTFRSGYLNVPLNFYFSKSKDGWYTGISLGFNIRNKNS